MTGKIAYFGKNGKVGFEEHELPEVEPGAMLVRVLSSNICGSDVKNWKTGASLGVGGDKTCQGHEFVGRIERLGEGVTKDYAGESVKAGDRVVAAYYITCGECRACKIGRYDQCGNAYIHLGQSPDDFPYFSGTFATHYYIHPRQYFYKVPDTLPDSLAAGANCRFSQIYYGLEHIGITAGETLLIQGAGSMGLYACAIAKEKGARRCLPLKVSGPFHTPLMAPAGNALREYFQGVAFADPQIPVIFNCLGDVKDDSTPIQELLVKQVQSSVFMEDSIRKMADMGVDAIVEIGPGKALSGFVKKTVPGIPVCAVETAADVENLPDTLEQLIKEKA